MSNSPIERKYHHHGGETGFLGKCLNSENFCADGKGKYQNFANGMIFWNPDLGAFEVHGGIVSKYAENNYERGALGYPVSDEMDWCGHDFWDMLPINNLVWYVPPVALAVCVAYLAVPRDLTKIGRWSKFEGGCITWFEHIKPPMGSDTWIWKRG